VESRLLGFPPFHTLSLPMACFGNAFHKNHNHREGHADRTASSDSRRTVLVQECFPLPPSAGSPGWTCVCFTFSISRMTIVKTSTSYFASASPARTSAILSSIWFQPSSCPLFFALSMGSFPMKVSFV